MSRVLIVEDEAHIAKGLRFNLEAEGHSVEIAGDGEHALERLLGHKSNGKKPGKRENSFREEFDAVVLDVMLPGKDGFTVAAELRAAKKYVPVLMLTARGRPEDVLKGFASGADDYLPKPFELPILLARLQGCCVAATGRGWGNLQLCRAIPPARLRCTASFHSMAGPSILASWNCGSRTPPFSSP